MLEFTNCFLSFNKISAKPKQDSADSKEGIISKEAKDEHNESVPSLLYADVKTNELTKDISSGGIPSSNVAVEQSKTQKNPCASQGRVKVIIF